MSIEPGVATLVEHAESSQRPPGDEDVGNNGGPASDGVRGSAVQANLHDATKHRLRMAAPADRASLFSKALRQWLALANWLQASTSETSDVHRGGSHVERIISVRSTCWLGCYAPFFAPFLKGPDEAQRQMLTRLRDRLATWSAADPVTRTQASIALVRPSTCTLFLMVRL